MYCVVVLLTYTVTTQRIEEHNRAGHSWTVGLNYFADLTNAEYQALYLMPQREHPVHDIFPTAPVSRISTAPGVYTSIWITVRCNRLA